MIGTEPKTGRQLFRRWYARHRKEYNSQRRAKYSTDADYRDLQMSYAVTTQTTQTTQKRRMQFRVVGGDEVRVYSVRDAVCHLGRSSETIKRWETLGLLPSNESGEHRVYMLHQLELMELIADAYDTYMYNKPRLDAELAKARAIIRQNW